MKEYKIELTVEWNRILKNAFREKKDIIKALLASIALLTYGNTTDRPSKDYLVLRIDKMKRLFIVESNRITSFNFPFGIEERQQENSLFVYDPITDLALEGVNLAILRSIFVDLMEDESSYSLIDLDSDIEKIMDSFDKHHEKDRLWSVMKHLIECETGYLRFDYDPEREDGLLHPLNHLDINYSNEVTYKLGLNSRKSVDELIDILDINTNCSSIL
ncbi:hypothetical protein D4741_20080 [Pseudoalteromonas gelatinilytica]|uniref:Uncharacterized protein n=1 Tax=Pseudoalteromonas gelatinilytica TaxID=1703256 RepID=A0A3A3EYI8_9GAMM|nr:hypothetical protein [Pseudoalteromonas profundi]RJF32072.1 hypothetical protein D4741_20080 [Pseudoalteromonas profundi]